MEAAVASGEQVVVYAPATTQWAAVKLGTAWAPWDLQSSELNCCGGGVTRVS